MVNTKNSFNPARLLPSVALAFATIGGAPVYAFQIDTGNSDIEMRWDNAVRYNAGWRMENTNPAFANAYNYDETENKFKKNDMVTNRLDLLSELDFTYKREYGFRVSGALWAENAYSSKSKAGSPLTDSTWGPFAPPSNYGPSGTYSPYAKRYLTGSSGEFLDAFVFGGIELGDTSLKFRVGQHNVYWGEAFFTVSNSIAAAQGPIDTIKAATSPGAEAKELFMPLNQISASLGLSNTLSINAQYLLDWKPYRLVPGGTYFALGTNSDGLAPCANVIPTAFPGASCLSSLDAITPGRDGGDYGLALRWNPDWFDNGTLGFYYRKYDEKLPWNTTQFSGAGPMTDQGNLGVRLVYARDTELWGFSLSKNVGPVNVGAEVSYRHNTALNSVAGYIVGSGGTDPNTLAMTVLPLGSTPSYAAAEGARGDTWHALINGVYLLPKTALWEGGTLQGEISYQKLDNVTKNSNLFYSMAYACKNGYLLGGLSAGARNKGDSCATDSAWSLNLAFAPEWNEVLPGVSLSMPTSLAYGIKGNAATLGGTNEGAYNYSIGLKAKYHTVYEFGLAYNDSHTDYKAGPSAFNASGVGSVAYSQNGSGAVQNNHGWLSFTFKTSF